MFKCVFGHKWNDWESEDSSPCRKVRVCQRCGNKQEQTNHTFGEWKYATPNSYMQEQTCQRCLRKNTRTYEASPPYPINSELAHQHAKSLREQAIKQRDLGSYGDARHSFKSAIISYPKDITSRYSWGEMELQLGNYEAARVLFKESTDIYTYHSSSWRNWGVLEKKAGHYDMARKLFIRSAKSIHHNSRAWLAWAILEKELGYFNKARRLFRQAVATDTKNYRAWHAWGVMEKDLGNYDEARRLFDTAILASPENTAPYQTWSLLELIQGNHDKAKELIKKALEINNEDQYVLVAYSEIQSKLGNESKARAALLNAKRLLETQLQKNPNYSLALNMLGRVLGDLEEFQDAMKILKQSANVSSVHEKHYAHSGLGEVYWNQGQFAQAIKEWKRALLLSPYHLATRNNLRYKAGLDNSIIEESHIREDDIVDSAFEALIEQITSESKVPHIARYFEERGYGFIGQPNKPNEPDLFFHVTHVKNPDAIQVGARLKCEVVDGRNGKEARNVVIL